MNELISEFRKRLLQWGLQNTRKYPWRWIDDPYRVLVSEFMLHRTQARQVIEVYNQFIQKYPSLEAFSKADVNHVRDSLQSLGLHWRIEGMIRALSQIWEKYKTIPLDRLKLMSIESIGQYIAGATVCFSENKPVALIDTNTVRVVGRVFGLDLSGEARRRKTVVDMISDACDPDHPRDYYYAMIDLAHQVCLPKKPDCTNCPLLDLPCQFGQDNISGLEV